MWSSLGHRHLPHVILNNWTFYGNTETHICIHLWTKMCCEKCASSRFERHVSKRLRSCWFLLVSCPTERKSNPFQMLTLAIMWYDIFMGKRVNKVKDPTFWMLPNRLSWWSVQTGRAAEMFISPLHVISSTVQLSFSATLQLQISTALVTFDHKRYGGLLQQHLWVIIPKNTHTDFDLSPIRHLQQQHESASVMSWCHQCTPPV